MYDIRLLTLYKQHYRDVYNTSLMCGYSCWGYFDGLDILPCLVPSKPSFYTSQDDLFSTLWAANGEKIAEQRGDFSTQNIGLLRYQAGDEGQRKTEQFWSDNLRMPFFAVMLVQLEKERDFTRVSALVEQKWSGQDECQGRKIVYNTISYYTFDNSDLVLLVHGNSMKTLQQTVHNIEALPDIQYVHSILGVSENYLSQCKKEGRILREFQDNDCCLDEKIPELQISVVANGDPENKNRMRLQLEHWAGKNVPKLLASATVSDRNGHETYVISLKDVQVADMLRLFIPGEFGTHQNPLYGKRVYNISTSLLFNQKRILDIPVEQVEKCPQSKTQTDKRLWCKFLMEKYCKELISAQEDKNESLCSYYQAMLQTLNTMSQYEQFELSENIFLALIPPFRMFSEQFSVSQTGQEDQQIQIKLEDSLCQFLDYANMVIYHIIHTDQTFLMVPGYSGTSFSIPIKLTLLFLWLSRKLTCVLNDSEYDYQFILTPVMESKPITHLVEFDTNNPNRLIAIKVSQRLLYRPRALTVILSHEIAHYVGTKTRCRKLRLECLSKLLAYYVAEQLLPSETWQKEDVLDNQANVCKEYYDLLLESLWYHLKENVEAFQECEPYAHQCAVQLARECRKWLVKQSIRTNSLVLRVPKQLEEKLMNGTEDYASLMRYLTQVQENVETNWRVLLESRICEDMIEESVAESREIFSDMAAFATLDCTMEESAEAFSASEGMVIDDTNRPAAQWFRQDIAHRVTGKGEALPENFHLREDNVKENLYQYDGIRGFLEEYATTCYWKIKTRLVLPEIRAVHEEIKEFYSLFSARNNSIDVDIYAKISEYIQEYKDEVKKWLKVR